MSVDSHFYFEYGKTRAAEFVAQAERDHMADLAVGPGQSVRARLANWLYAMAERLEGHPLPAQESGDTLEELCPLPN